MARKSRGAVQAPVAPVVAPAPVKPAPIKYSGEMIRVPRGEREYKIPREVYDGKDPDLTVQDVIRLTDAAEADQGDGRVALDGVGQLLTLFDQMRAELNAERAARQEMESTVLALATAMEQLVTKVRMEASEELAQQLVELGATIANAGAVRADLDGSAERFRVERANTEQWFANETAALQQPVVELRGTVKSTTTLMAERSAALEDKLAADESREQRLDVRLQELEGKTDAWTNPITRPEMVEVVKGVVTQEMGAQLEPLMDQLVARKYVTTAPTTGSDGYRQESNANSAPVPFLTKQPGEGAMERAVNRALKKGGKG